MALSACRFTLFKPFEFLFFTSNAVGNRRKLLKRRVCTSQIADQKCSTKFRRFLSPPWNVLFFGNDEFSLESLKPLNAKLNTGTLISSLAVVTGRSSLVRKFCGEEGLTVYEWPVDQELIKNKYHIGMVVSFGHMIPKAVIEAFPLGCVNIHSSILPKYRGAAPIIHAVLNGDSESGVTLMRVHPHKFDVGEIVRQYRVSISPTETSVELEDRLAKCGSQLLMECVRDLPRCLEMAVPQPSEGVSYAPKVNSSMATVIWDRMNALDVFNMHRALGHIYPLTTTWHNSRIKLLDVSIQNDSRAHKIEPSLLDTSENKLHKSALNFLNDTKPNKDVFKSEDSGKIKFSRVDKVLKVVCKDGNEISASRLAVGGKKISATDFFNGYLSKRPSKEWRFGVH